MTAFLLFPSIIWQFPLPLEIKSKFVVTTKKILSAFFVLPKQQKALSAVSIWQFPGWKLFSSAWTTLKKIKIVSFFFHRWSQYSMSIYHSENNLIFILAIFEKRKSGGFYWKVTFLRILNKKALCNRHKAN